MSVAVPAMTSPTTKQHGRGHERRQGSGPVGPVSGDDHADDSGRERHREREREQRLAVEVVGDEGMIVVTAIASNAARKMIENMPIDSHR